MRDQSSSSRVPDRAELLKRGEFVRLAYRLGRSRATGVLAVYRPGRGESRRSSRATTEARDRPDVLVLRRGHLIAPSTGKNSQSRQGASANRSQQPLAIRTGFSRVLIDREIARRLSDLASLEGARYTFDGGLAAYPPGAVGRQFPLAAWARHHLEAQVDSAQAQRMLEDLAGVRMTVSRHLAPDPSLCDETDLRILDAMRMPRRIDQIWALACTPRFRLLSFLHFLDSVGALSLNGIARASYPSHDQPSRGQAPEQAPDQAPDPSQSRPQRSDNRQPTEHPSAHRVLGVASDADRATVKRAYRRLARSLHPDLHPGVSDARRRALERKLADVTNAYVELTGSTPG